MAAMRMHNASRMQFLKWDQRPPLGIPLNAQQFSYLLYVKPGGVAAFIAGRDIDVAVAVVSIDRTT